MVILGGMTHLVLWGFEVVVRHEIGGIDGPAVDLAMTSGEGLAALGVIAAVLIAVHLILWVEVRRPDLQEADEPRLVRLDVLVLASGVGAAWVGVAGLASVGGGGTVTGGRLSAGVAALLVVGLAADAAVAVKAEVLQRDALRVRRGRRDALQRLVDRVGDDGPESQRAVLRLAGGVAAAGIAGWGGSMLSDRALTTGLVDGAVVALAALFVLGAIGGGAILWWDRREWSNFVLGPSLLVALLSGLALSAAPASRLGSGWWDLVTAVAAGFVGPCVGALLSVVRRRGSARALIAVWFRWQLRRVEAGVDAAAGGAAT